MTLDEKMYCQHCKEAIVDFGVGFKFCPHCGKSLQKAEGQREERYDVFLSYSHADAEQYGKETIDKIKQEIQSELNDHVCRPLVFLDGDALKYGDEWQAKIMEKMNECRIFICLLSQNYFNSSYCARERLWWAQKEIREGRLRKDTYPVYYIQIEPDPWLFPTENTKDLFGIQQGQKLVPWIKGKEGAKEIFIRERLDVLKSDIKKRLDCKSVAKNSFCSIIPKVSENFVGRILELKELREICANGHYPIIQAAGGVGKSELAVAYAFGYADEYPMGRFLIHMEGVRTWRDALLSMVRDSATGRKTREVLNISDEDMEKSPEDLHVLIARGLFARAEKGRVLLLLDNVDDCSIFSGKKLQGFSPETDLLPSGLHMIGTSRQSLEYPERSRAQAMTINNLKRDEAFELFCLIGGNKFPFGKRCEIEEDPESKALRDIISLLDGHTWSMEVIAGYMAENYNNGMTFVQKLLDLQENYIVDGDESWRNVGNSRFLIKPTLELIRTLPLGEAVLEILSVASLMHPDMIYSNVLEAYWRKYYGHIEYKDGVPFEYALNILNKYHLLNGDLKKKKIHRLTQGAVKEYLGEKISIYASRLAPILEETITFSQEDWCAAIITTPELYATASQEFKDYKFLLDNWIQLLQYPRFEKYCPWGRLNGNEWADLLVRHPQFADRCPWEKLSDGNWVDLLSKQPQLINKLLRDKLTAYKINTFAKDTWYDILKKQPQLINICPIEKLDALEWFHDRGMYVVRSRYAIIITELIRQIPQYSGEVKWNKLQTCCDDWSYVLSNHPQFADKCPWDKLAGRNFSYLLSNQPQFADRCPWEKLYGGDWAVLLGAQPQFADRCPWEKLEGGDWAKLLSEKPQFADKCLWERLGGDNWVVLLSNQPQFADKCNFEKVKMKVFDWGDLLARQPQFADRCPHKEYKSKENPQDKFSTEHLLSLLRKNPTQFVDECPWGKLDGGDWADLLSEQPQFADRCPWGKLSGDNWAKLLSKQPQFSDRCTWEKLRGANWVDLLSKQPQLADKCSWHLLNVPCWIALLKKAPQFIEKCPSQILKGIYNYERYKLVKDFPFLVDKSDFLEGFNVTMWMELLIRYPQLADKCPWEEMETRLYFSEWFKLLRIRPQFIVKCPLDVVEFIMEHHFADKFEWENLDGEDWIHILERHPRFCDRVSMEMLGDIESELWSEQVRRRFDALWDNLIAVQPQFSKYRKPNKVYPKGIEEAL